jgi:hypothetical protein
VTPPSVRRPVHVLGVLLAVLAVIAVASTTCARPERRSLPPPSSTSSTQPPETTTTVDRSRIPLPVVAGVTTTTVNDSGRAVLQGVVVGPDGNVPDAVIRIERLVGDTVQVREVRTGPEGTFAVDGLPGGRMRVRAYAPPTLTMAAPDIFFLADGEARDLRLTVTRHDGPDVRASTAPRAPVVGDLVNVLVWVAERVVDGEGVARTVPRAGVPVEIRSSGWVFVEGRSVTDGEGNALFTFRCERASPVTATAFIGTVDDQRAYPLEVPPCAERPVTTTTTTTTPATTTTTAATTTTEG